MEKRLYYRYEPNEKGKFSIKEKLLFGAYKNCFITKEEATIHFEKAEKVALEKYEEIIIGIDKLKEKLGNFSYDCQVETLDDTGLEIKMCIDFDVDGYEFKFIQ